MGKGWLNYAINWSSFTKLIQVIVLFYVHDLFFYCIFSRLISRTAEWAMLLKYKVPT